MADLKVRPKPTLSTWLAARDRKRVIEDLERMSGLSHMGSTS